MPHAQVPPAERGDAQVPPLVTATRSYGRRTEASPGQIPADGPPRPARSRPAPAGMAGASSRRPSRGPPRPWLIAHPRLGFDQSAGSDLAGMYSGLDRPTGSRCRRRLRHLRRWVKVVRERPGAVSESSSCRPVSHGGHGGFLTDPPPTAASSQGPCPGPPRPSPEWAGSDLPVTQS